MEKRSVRELVTEPWYFDVKVVFEYVQVRV